MKYFICPFYSHQIGNVEEWLSVKASEGYFLKSKKFGLYGFEKGEPKTLYYKRLNFSERLPKKDEVKLKKDIKDEYAETEGRLVFFSGKVAYYENEKPFSDGFSVSVAKKSKSFLNLFGGLLLCFSSLAYILIALGFYFDYRNILEILLFLPTMLVGACFSVISLFKFFQFLHWKTGAKKSKRQKTRFKTRKSLALFYRPFTALISLFCFFVICMQFVLAIRTSYGEKTVDSLPQGAFRVDSLSYEFEDMVFDEESFANKYSQFGDYFSDVIYSYEHRKFLGNEGSFLSVRQTYFHSSKKFFTDFFFDKTHNKNKGLYEWQDITETQDNPGFKKLYLSHDWRFLALKGNSFVMIDILFFDDEIIIEGSAVTIEVYEILVKIMNAAYLSMA